MKNNQTDIKDANIVRKNVSPMSVELDDTDTIAAIATGLTESGIGIVRISGPQSYEIIKKIFVTKSGHVPELKESHRVRYGKIVDYVSRETLDEVLVLNMKGPHSYTGEDSVEIDCHGGVLMMKRILENVCRAGARLAEPGEFTKRAFLNGRMDLSQAEAVIDLIDAKNDRALKASVAQLKGSVSEKIKKLRAVLLEDTAYIEAALDDPEHISLDGFSEKLETDVNTVMNELNALIDSAEDGRVIKEGICTVIVGKPNAGKSSLLNALLGEERAIVTDIAGTTRDTLEASINLKGVTLNVIDTAGIRQTTDTVEQIGVERALHAVKQADLIIYVVDGSIELDDSDSQIIELINTVRKKTIVLMNKSDLERKLEESELRKVFKTPVEVLELSTRNLIGIDMLEQKIEELFYAGHLNYNDEVLITSARQKAALIVAAQSMQEVKTSIEMSMPEDFYAIDLMNAYSQLGTILGEEVDEDLVNEIFGKFCMGK